MRKILYAGFSRVKSLIILVFILFLYSELNAQIYVVQYMKVKDGKFSEYRAIEKAWMKLHQKLVDNGNLIRWTLYSKMFGGTNDEYDYITVNVYPDWATFEKPASEEIINFANDEMEVEMNSTSEVRDLIRQEIYTASVLAENSILSEIIQISYMKVDHTGFGKYVDLEKKYFKPYFEGLIDAGARNSWGVYQRNTPMGGSFNFIAVNGFEKLSQPDEVSSELMDEAWEKAKNGVPEDKILEETYNARETVHSEYWRRVWSTTEKEE